MNIQPAWLSGLVGTVAPLIVHWIAKENFTRRQKSAVALIVSCAVGFASAYLSGQFHTEEVLKAAATAFAVSQVVYDQLFKDLFKRNREELPFT